MLAPHPGALSAAARARTGSRSRAPSPQSSWGRPAGGAGRPATQKPTQRASARVAAPTPAPTPQKPAPAVSQSLPRPAAPPAASLRVCRAVCCPLRSHQAARPPLRSDRSGKNAPPCPAARAGHKWKLPARRRAAGVTCTRSLESFCKLNPRGRIASKPARARFARAGELNAEQTATRRSSEGRFDFRLVLEIESRPPTDNPLSIPTPCRKTV